VGDLAVGEDTSLNISHVIEAHSADRFLIALQTTRSLNLRLCLDYNKRFSVSENAWIWGSKDGTPSFSWTAMELMCSLAPPRSKQ
jgi:hypothetical protein